MRTYELTIIVDAQLAPETQEEVIAKFLDFLKENKIEIQNIEKWGKKKLAYAIDDHQYGHYLMTQFQAEVDVIPELERHLKLSPHIIRHLLLLRDPKTLKLMELESERRAHEALVTAEPLRDQNGTEKAVEKPNGAEDNASDDSEEKQDDA